MENIQYLSTLSYNIITLNNNTTYCEGLRSHFSMSPLIVKAIKESYHMYSMLG